MSRDLSQKQFDAACKRHGFKPEGIMGYYYLPCGVTASVLNAGSNRRAQLAFLIQIQAKWEKRLEAEAALSKWSATGTPEASVHHG